MLARTTKKPIANHEGIEDFLEEAAGLLRMPRLDRDAPFFFGIDLGTATIVITAVNAVGQPVYWDSVACEAVRDGVVVNFAGAVAAVQELKLAATAALGCEISSAATAFPPGVPSAEARAVIWLVATSKLTSNVKGTDTVLGLSTPRK